MRFGPVLCILGAEGFRLWSLGAQVSVVKLLSNQGEKSINLYFIMVPLRKKY